MKPLVRLPRRVGMRTQTVDMRLYYTTRQLVERICYVAYD